MRNHKKKDPSSICRLPFRSTLIGYLIVALFLLPLAEGLAMFLPTDQIITHESDRLPPMKQADLGRIQTVLESRIIQQRLTDLGLSKEEVSTRLSTLSDDELHEVARQIDTLYVGGDGFTSVAVLLIIAILVVILLRVSGYKVIVTK